MLAPDEYTPANILIWGRQSTWTLGGMQRHFVGGAQGVRSSGVNMCPCEPLSDFGRPILWMDEIRFAPFRLRHPGSWLLLGNILHVCLLWDSG